MRKKTLVLLVAYVMAAAVLGGCNSSQTKGSGSTEQAVSAAKQTTDNTNQEAASAAEQITGDTNQETTGNTEQEAASAAKQITSNTNQEAADRAAAFIDAIYVQERTADTDAQCEAAKAAWDALTEEQKELVASENADPDYFGRDTGDASKDDPLNADDIGENELLAVSFGTSFNTSRTDDIGGVEKALQKANPNWSVRRAFTAQIIINHIQARDGEKIDNMEQALERAAANGVKNLVIQPTHLMHGAEYDELTQAAEKYQDKFETVKIAEPLLGEASADAAQINEDKEAAAKAIMAEAVTAAGYDNAEAAAEAGAAFVFMGHGTSHTASVTYSQMQAQMENLGYRNAFIGTVEGKPEDTACEAVIGKVREAGYKKIILRPLMVVAGDHANNDMAGDEKDSWKSRFEASGNFDRVDTQIAGLGGISDIQSMYAAHTAAAIGSDELAAKDTANAEALADGIYSADFNTDSSMFHANEANDGKGTLTVENGEMMLHVSMPSKNIVNLFTGTAGDAQKDGAELLLPVTDTVTYSDGTTEEVYGFDIPISAIDEEFDLALIGTKGVWYDHKVSVSNPEQAEAALEESALETGDKRMPGDGEYTANVTAEGGSGKASIESPVKITVKDGQAYAAIVWSSENYDYMIADGKKYMNENTEGNSVFTIPVPGFDYQMPVIADTTAMSTPHEIEYTLHFEWLE